MKCFKKLAILVVLTGVSLFSDEPASQTALNVCSVPSPITSNEHPPSQGICCPQECVSDHRVQVGGNYTYAWVRPTANPTTSGSLGGAQAIYEYQPGNWLYAALAFNYRQGSTQGGVSKRTLLDLDSQERLGYTFANRNQTYRLGLFSGLGGRYMSEKVTVGSTSVTFNYTHFYVPVGFLYDYTCNSWLNWGLNFQWRPQIFPTVQIVPLDGARWILTKHIDNFSIDMPIAFQCTEHLSCIIAPFFELWHDGQTTAETLTGLLLALPGNRYCFAGVNVNLAWEF